ncbi:ATP-dependent DNA ligase [Candidatus Micrarchaeota archaeon]|nr:ATP-dependent DNA ligase [Candidatus Micrarchaeota archaeon]
MLFKELAEAYEKIEATAGRLEMTAILAELFSKAKASDVAIIVYLTQGRVAPPHEGIEVGIGEKFVERAIAGTTGYSLKEVGKKFKEKGDFGLVAEELAGKKKQQSLASEELSVEKVFESFMKIAKSSGAGSQELKVKLLGELLNSASSVEARYIARFPLDQLRLGVGDPTILDAFSQLKRGDKSLREELERAYNLCNDLGLVARVLLEEGEEGIRRFKVRAFSPIRPALAERLSSAEEIIEKLGECVVESKYDGFRCQVHKKGDKVKLYSRKLEETTKMFPEIVEAVKKQVKANEAVFEGEALAFNEESGEYLPFQVTIQRKRKHGVKEMAEEFPLKLFAFDLLYADGKDYTVEVFEERRKKLGEMIGKGGEIKLSEAKRVKTAKELEDYFEDRVSKGLEGIVAKDLKQKYVAGARKFAWIKLKRSYKGELADTLDVVVLGYYLGKGARTEFGFGGLLAGVYDEKNCEFKTIAKIGSGFTEEQMKELEKELEKIKVKAKPKNVNSLLEPDVWVEAKFVVTVSADEITRSPVHSCGKKGEAQGYALRFPRMVGSGIRSDKAPQDATSEKEVIKLFGMQKRTQKSE